jgi:Right handed beta helix region
MRKTKLVMIFFNVGGDYLLGRLGCFFLSALLISPAPRTHAASYYVSGANGNDVWSGRLPAPNPLRTDGPLRTLAKAKSKMESGPIKTATVRGGTYDVSGTGFLAFGPSDAGETWVPYQGERPIIDGGGAPFIDIHGANNLTIEGFTFQHFGSGSGPSSTLNIHGCSNVTVRWNTFLNCSGRCISVANVHSSLIDSNTFQGQSPAKQSHGNYYVIDIGGPDSSQNRVTHNLIENAEGGGIALFVTSQTPGAGSNNVIDRNIIKNVMKTASDGAGLYAWELYDVATGNQITNNVVYGSGGTNWSSANARAVYLDDRVSNVLVEGNICNKCGGQAVMIHGGKNNTVKNNIFDITGSNKLGFYQNNGKSDMAGNTFTNNIIWSESAFPNTLWLNYNKPPTPLDKHTNLYCSGDGSPIYNVLPIKDADPKYCCPGFANPGNNDYTIPQGSCAYSQIGWQTLPTDQGPLPNPFTSGGAAPSIQAP